MNDRWYIWYEVFEDGAKVGSGMYPRSYSSREGARKRAKQMWSEDQFNPMTGTTISYKWTVRQNKPFERGQMYA